MADKYKNINKILRKYGQKTISDLINIVGVDTGALKSSINFKLDKDDGYIVKMLDYGQYVSPWIKKGNGQNYIQVFDKLMPKFKKELSKAYAKDVANEIKNNADKVENIKSK